MGATQSKKALKSALKKHRMDKPKKGTRRNKTGTKKACGRDDASEEGGAPSTPTTPASRSGGLIPTTIAVGGGGSSSTLSSLNTTAGGGAGTASALPLPRSKSDTRKFTSEAAKRLSAGPGSRKSLAADEGAQKTAGNEGGGKNTASGVAAPKKTLAEHSRRTALEPADGAGGGGASKRLRSASNSSARGGSKRLSGAGLHNSLNNPTTSQSPSCGARTSGSFTVQASSGSPRQGTFTVTPGSRASTRLSATFNKDNNAFTNNKDQSTALVGGKTTNTSGLMGKLGGGSGYNKNVGGGGRAVKSGVITGTGSSQRSGGRTATVTPSDVAFGKRTPKSLPRFGFIDSPSLRSGESTDSVNSILSDVLLSSDSNSNILDYYEEHSGNRGGGGEEIQGEGGEDCLSKRITKTNNLKNNLLLCQPSSAEGRSASSSRCDDVIVHSCSSPKSPTSISQASSGVTAAATTARLKAHTHQLPQPQLPAVRSFSTSASALNERKISSSSFFNAESVAKRREGVSFGQRKRPVSMTSPDTTTDVSCFQPHGPSHKLTAHITACPVTFKAVTNGAVNKSFSVTPSPVDDKDSESPKSINTLDSGLGSSMEGDKLKDATSDTSFRSGDALGAVNEKSPCILPQPTVHAAYPSLDGRLQVTDIKRNHFINAGPVEASNGTTVMPNHFMNAGPVQASNGTTVMPNQSSRCNDDIMKTSLIDESDKWLREKKNKMGKACKLQTGTFLKPAALSFTNVLKVDTSKQLTTSVEPAASKEPASGNEPYMTYGVARQNLAVSDRNRFGFLAKTYLTQPSATKLDSANKSKLNKSPSDPGKRLACYNSTAAYASKLTRVNSNPSSMKTTTFRPTSLIKTPILVTPVSNETVEISKPILKKLEYTAGSSCSGKDSINSASVDRVRSHRKNSAEDLLMVSCLEVQVSTDEGDITSTNGLNEQSSPSNSTQKNRRELAFNKKLNHKTSITSSYNILESPTAPESMLVASKLDGFSLVSPSVLSRDESKLLSPESESSFEVLDSPSEGLDYTDSSACNTVLCPEPAYPDIMQDSNTALGNVSGYLQKYDVELIVDESTLEKPKLMESPLHKAQQQPRDDRQDIPSSSKVFHSSGSSDISEDAKLSGCYSAQVDQLTTSLGKSSLIESLTNAVLRESLELPITANRSSDNSREATNHSAFYSITATTSSGSSDIQHQFDKVTAGGGPSSGANEEGSGYDNISREGSLGPENLSKTDDIEKFMNNLNNSKLEIVDILNNFAIKPGRTDSTSLVNSLVSDVNQNISIPQYSQTFESETENSNFNFSSIDEVSNQTTFNTTSTALTTYSTAINESQVNCQEVPTSTVTNDPVPDPAVGANSTSIMMMSTSSSVISESNSSPGGRFTPSSQLTRCHSSSGGGGAGGGLQPNTSSSGGGGTGSSVTGGPADMDQDFLIDDEISDQPDLTFYGDDMCSVSVAGRGLDQSDLGLFGDVDDYLNNYQLPPPQQLQKYRQEPVCSTAKKRTPRTANREDSSGLDEEAYYPGEEEGEHESDCEGQQQQQQQGHGGDGEDLVSSDDEGIFGDDLQQPSPCHAVRRIGVEVVPGGASSAPSSGAGLLPLCFDDLRTAGRPDSVCTLATSLDPDDFMLDFEIDDFSSQRCATPPGSLGSVGCGSSSLRSTGSNSRHCSPHHGPSSTNGSGLKRPLGSLSRADGSKPTRLPVLRQQLDGEHSHGSPVPALDKALQQQLLLDCHSTKTMLLQLRNLLLHADTAPPYALSKKMGDEAGVDCGEASDGVLGTDQVACTTDSIPRLVQQNADLRRQVTLLQQQLEERDRTMRNLQQRLHVTSSQPFTAPTSLHSGGSAGVPGTSDPGLMSRSLGSDSLVETSKNAATQTDRPGRPLTSSSLTRPPSIDDGLGPTVRFMSSEDVIGAPCTNGTRRPPSRLALPSPCLDSAVSNTSETRSTHGLHRRPLSLAGLDDALDSSRIPRTGVTSCSDTSTDGKASFLRCSSDDCGNTLLCSSNTSFASSNGGYPSSARCRHLSGDSILSSNSSVDGEPVLSNGHYTNGCSPSSSLASNDKPSQYTSQHNTVSNRGIGGRCTRRQSPSQEDITCKTFQEKKEMFSAVSTARGLAAHQPS